MGRTKKGRFYHYDGSGHLVSIEKNFRSNAAMRDWKADMAVEAMKPKQYLTGLFGEKIPIKPKKLPDQKYIAQVTERDEKIDKIDSQAMDYAMVEAIEARPKTTKSKPCCLFCGNQAAEMGLSIGFLFFVICYDCVQLGLDDFSLPGPRPLGECTRCFPQILGDKRTPEQKAALYKPLYRGTHTHPSTMGDLGQAGDDICLDCLKLGNSMLTPIMYTPKFERHHAVAHKGEGTGSLLLNL